MNEQLLREWIREISSVDRILSEAVVHHARAIAQVTGGIFKAGSTSGGAARLVTEPGKNQQAKNSDYKAFLRNAGYTIVNTIKPKFPGAASGSFDTYVVTAPDGEEISVVFGVRDPEAKERIQIGEINQAISQRINLAISTLNSGTGIDINLGRKVAKNVVKAVKATKGAKADTHLMNSKDEIVGQISLKATDASSGMNQWGGISKYAGEPEVSKYANAVKRWMTKNGYQQFPEKVVLRCKVQDPALAHKVVFGPDDEVDLVIASVSAIGIKLAGTEYVFTGDHLWPNPRLPKGRWTPSFITRRAGRRKELGIPGARSFIATYAYRDPVSESYKNIETVCESVVCGLIYETLILEELTKTDVEKIMKRQLRRIIKESLNEMHPGDWDKPGVEKDPQRPWGTYAEKDDGSYRDTIVMSPNGDSYLVDGRETYLQDVPDQLQHASGIEMSDVDADNLIFALETQEQDGYVELGVEYKDGKWNW